MVSMGSCIVLMVTSFQWRNSHRESCDLSCDYVLDHRTLDGIVYYSISRYFNGTNCTSLIGKPKVFILQVSCPFCCHVM